MDENPTPAIDLKKATLLQLLADAPKGTLAPIKVMKGVFLVDQEAPQDWLAQEDRYVFRPYNYGPYTSTVTDDLKRLAARGLVTMREIPGRSWHEYSITDAGRSAVADAPIDPRLRAYIKQIADFVSRSSFEQLLKVVYSKYPQFAVNTIFSAR